MYIYNVKLKQLEIMTTLKTITNGKRATEIVDNGTCIIAFNWVNKAQNVMSHTNSSKTFKTVRGAERFANKFVNA